MYNKQSQLLFCRPKHQVKEIEMALEEEELLANKELGRARRNALMDELKKLTSMAALMVVGHCDVPISLSGLVLASLAHLKIAEAHHLSPVRFLSYAQLSGL
ncbi:hypothetical protein FNV43_RR14308 [Rhamnella rubrinervis]|uniref:Uncharacterized protein n=1 Tax=Rhamnella rubrinervis TaxID=2594499 RepID=A0A8K0H2L6_9ROSA|nr:hypothetical protein FNV43_RR14308 [Rhamnella rubrinervis]